MRPMICNLLLLYALTGKALNCLMSAFFGTCHDIAARLCTSEPGTQTPVPETQHALAL